MARRTAMLCRIIKAGCCLLVLTAISSIAIAGIPPRPNPEAFLSCLAGPSYNEKKCGRAKRQFERHFTGVSDECKDADSWEIKKIYLKRLLELYFSTEHQFLEDERMVSYEDMCGAFLWEGNTWVQLYTDDIVPPDHDDLTLELEVGDEVEVHARIFTRICEEADWRCGPEVELPYSGQWAWGSFDTNVFEVESEYARSGRVKAAGDGQAILIAQMPEFEEDPYLLQGLADVIVGTQEGVDIALVMESGNATYDYVGLPLYWCDEDACLGWPGDTWWDPASFWGLCGSPGEQFLGNFQVEDPGVLAISVDEDGPFGAGPLSITFTCGDDGIAKTDKLWFKPLAEGVTRVDYCIGETCDPLLYDPDRSRFGWWGDEFSIGTAYQDPIEPPGLIQIGSQVAALLDNKFSDYRFAATAMGAHPEFAVECSGYEGQEWYLPDFDPWWDTTPYVDFLSFTSDPSTVAGGLGQIRPICSDPIPVYDPIIGGKSVYSATIHAINDFAWRSDAELRTLIVFSVNPACYEVPDDPPYCDVEKGSGYTRQDVIDAAIAADVRLIMINAGWGSYRERMRDPFQEIALQTDGWYTEDDLDFWPMLTTFETSFDWIWNQSSSSRK
jgi:hypothetical protein